jgi:hypothetical protein
MEGTETDAMESGSPCLLCLRGFFLYGEEMR